MSHVVYKRRLVKKVFADLGIGDRISRKADGGRRLETILEILD